MPSIAGKTVLVTGASSGIGKATVYKLLEAGAVVYAASRRVDKMKELIEAGAAVMEMDITNDQSMTHGINTILSAHGAVDILINNAGYGSYGAVEDVSLDEARKQFEVNLFGLARLVQLVLPDMRKNSYGKIVNISSMAGKIYTPFGAWYHASKHALEGLSDCLRLETVPFGIDTIIIEPGGIKTDWGLIAAEHLKNSSKDGAYALAASKNAERMAELYTGNTLSDVSVISRTVLKAVTARKPRTRYAVGYMSALSIFLRKVLTDRAFDRLILSMM